jgi:hypothetical protein
MSKEVVTIINRIIALECGTAKFESYENLLNARIEKMNQNQESLEIMEWRQFLIQTNDDKNPTKEEQLECAVILISNFTQINLKVSGLNLIFFDNF